MTVIGSLNWLANTTHPDVAFITNKLAKYVTDPQPVHYSGVTKVLRYLKGTVTHGIHFKRGTATNLSEVPPSHAFFTYTHKDVTVKLADLHSYVDADHTADKDDRQSVTGYVFYLNGAPISWSSRQQTYGALFSMKAECMDVYAAAQESKGLRAYSPNCKWN